VDFESGCKLKSIEAGAFWGCPSLSSFVIPAGLSSIGQFALAGTALTRIDIEDGNCSFSIFGRRLFDGLFKTIDRSLLWQ
jgi:hypothetical protein